MEKNVVEKSKALESYIINKRREFHKYPEVKFEEVRTSAIVAEELNKLGLEVTTGVAKTGVTGVLRGKVEKMVALRADMDALPLEENNDLPYKSTVPGKMHACGHDAHTAMLLGTARVLSEMKDELNGSVKFIFQPGEEGGGGARIMIEEGVLKGVDAIFGLHVWAEFPSGVIATKEGPILASSDGFVISIQGKGGHAAAPHLTSDPTVPAVDIYNALQKVVSKNISPLEPVVITTPIINGSNAYNIIPDRAEVRGTFRTFDMKIREGVIERIKEISENYARAWRCEASVELSREPYPPTINDPEMTRFMKKVAETIAPVREAEKRMGAEDFSFYLQQIPGSLALLGIKNEEKEITYPHHHPRFDVDEGVLYLGTAFYALLAYRYLKEFSK